MSKLHTTAVLLFATLATVRAQAPQPVPPPAPPVPPAPLAPPTTLQAAWQLALTTMREQKAPGLVFVLPAADAVADPAAVRRALDRIPGKGRGTWPTATATARDLLLLQLQVLRGALAIGDESPAAAHPDDRAPALALAFGLAVPVVATAAQSGARAGETVVLLGATGQRLAGFTVDLGDAAAVHAALLPHLLTNAVLAPRQANTPAAVRAAIEAQRQFRAKPPVAAAESQRYVATYELLRRELFAAAPAMVAVEPEQRLTADGALRELLQFTVPLGTMVASQWDPCPPCGMMAVSAPFRSALKLLAE